MKGLRIAGLALTAAIAAGVLWLVVPRPDPMPRDDASARLALRLALTRQGLRIPDKQLVLLSSTNSFLAGLWAFGMLNPTYELVGGSRYQRIYLVGPSVAPSREVGLGSFHVTTNHVEALIHLLSRRPPRADSEALEVARCAAWLLAGTRPEKLHVLAASEIPAALEKFLVQAQPGMARALAQEISAPVVRPHQTRYGTPPGVPVYTVEFCTHLPEAWGDIVFWHMEIGTGIFSVARRPIYLAPRVLD